MYSNKLTIIIYSRGVPESAQYLICDWSIVTTYIIVTNNIIIVL